MDSMEDSGIDSDNKTSSNDKKPEESEKSQNVVYKNLVKTSDLQKKIEKQRGKKQKKNIVESQPKKSFLLPRNRLSIPSKQSTVPLLQHDLPLVEIPSDSEEDEFAVGAPLTREAQREITQQLIKDGYNLDLEPDDDDLDLIPPRPLHERWSCCPAATWAPNRCTLQ